MFVNPKKKVSFSSRIAIFRGDFESEFVNLVNIFLKLQCRCRQTQCPSRLQLISNRNVWLVTIESRMLSPITIFTARKLIRRISRQVNFKMNGKCRTKLRINFESVPVATPAHVFTSSTNTRISTSYWIWKYDASTSNTKQPRQIWRNHMRYDAATSNVTQSIIDPQFETGVCETG